MKFKFIWLGQSIMKFEVPLDIFDSINKIYEENISTLDKANKQLAGKINNEHSLFYQGKDTPKMSPHNKLPTNILKWFEETYKFYLDKNGVNEYILRLSSIWVNEMTAGEYNPIHIHQGSLFTGLSSVMILKVPSHFGKEYSAEDYPTNGQLQLMGNGIGQFATVDYSPKYAPRDFYVFPYDIRHCVYPFNGTNETRRTLAANCDVEYDVGANRGAS